MMGMVAYFAIDFWLYLFSGRSYMARACVVCLFVSDLAE